MAFHVLPDDPRIRRWRRGSCRSRVKRRCPMNGKEAKIVFWHRELPPLVAELVAEHTVEANSSRVPGTLAQRNELWDRCYRELMANAEHRLVQEVTRLG